MRQRVPKGRMKEWLYGFLGGVSVDYLSNPRNDHIPAIRARVIKNYLRTWRERLEAD